MSQLAIDLIRPWAMQPLCIPTLQCHLRSIIKDIFDVKEPANPITRHQELQSRKRCRLCPVDSDNKTSKQCNKCARPICGQHVITFVKIVFKENLALVDIV